jgi:hypothetical protein
MYANNLNLRNYKFVSVSSLLILRYLCWFVYSGAQRILCFVFVLFVFVLCFVCLMLPVSLYCPLLITPSVLCNVYSNRILRIQWWIYFQHTKFIWVANLQERFNTLDRWAVYVCNRKWNVDIKVYILTFVENSGIC